MRGSVKWFDAEKGWGFIESAGEPDVFVHFSGLSDSLRDANGRRAVTQGQTVEFETRPGRKGVEAYDVRVVG